MSGRVRLGIPIGSGILIFAAAALVAYFVVHHHSPTTCDFQVTFADGARQMLHPDMELSDADLAREFREAIAPMFADLSLPPPGGFRELAGYSGGFKYEADDEGDDMVRSVRSGARERGIEGMEVRFTITTRIRPTAIVLMPDGSIYIMPQEEAGKPEPQWQVHILKNDGMDYQLAKFLVDAVREAHSHHKMAVGVRP